MAVETNHIDDVHFIAEMPKSSNPVESGTRNCWRDMHLRTSRDNKTAIELFLAGLRGWEGGIRRRFGDGTLHSD